MAHRGGFGGTGVLTADLRVLAGAGEAVRLEPLPPDVLVAFDGRRVRLPVSVQEEIERYWARARGANPALKRGVVLSVAGARREPQRLVLETAVTDYAHFLATRDDRIEREHACRPLHVAALVRSADGQLLIGEMAAHTAWPGRLTLIAGGVDVAHVRAGVVDADRSLHAELVEELGIDADDGRTVAAIEPRHLKHGGPRGFVGLLSLVTLRVDAATAIAIYRRRAGDRPELSDVLAVPARPDAVERFLAEDARPRVDYLADALRAEAGAG